VALVAERALIDILIGAAGHGPGARLEAVLFEEARLAIRNAQDATAALMREQIIPDPPAAEPREA